MQMFSWLPAMADGAKGGQAAPADITSPRPEESWIDELTVSQLTDNPTGGGEAEHSARSMEQQRSLKEWLEGIKPGYASRFAVAFEAAGVEDSDDLEHMDLGIYREVEAALAQLCDAKPMHLKNIRLALEPLCGCVLEVPVSPPAPSTDRSSTDRSTDRSTSTSKWAHVRQQLRPRASGGAQHGAVRAATSTASSPGSEQQLRIVHRLVRAASWTSSSSKAASVSSASSASSSKEASAAAVRRATPSRRRPTGASSASSHRSQLRRAGSSAHLGASSSYLAASAPSTCSHAATARAAGATSARAASTSASSSRGGGGGGGGGGSGGSSGSSGGSSGSSGGGGGGGGRRPAPLDLPPSPPGRFAAVVAVPTAATPTAASAFTPARAFTPAPPEPAESAAIKAGSSSTRRSGASAISSATSTGASTGTRSRFTSTTPTPPLWKAEAPSSTPCEEPSPASVIASLIRGWEIHGLPLDDGR